MTLHLLCYLYVTFSIGVGKDSNPYRNAHARVGVGICVSIFYVGISSKSVNKLKTPTILIGLLPLLQRQQPLVDLPISNRRGPYTVPRAIDRSLAQPCFEELSMSRPPHRQQAQESSCYKASKSFP